MMIPKDPSYTGKEMSAPNISVEEVLVSLIQQTAHSYVRDYDIAISDSLRDYIIDQFILRTRNEKVENETAETVTPTRGEGRHPLH